MYNNNYDTDKTAFEDKYANISFPTEKIKCCISESDHPAVGRHQGPGKETGGGQEAHVWLGDLHDAHDKISYLQTPEMWRGLLFQ